MSRGVPVAILLDLREERKLDESGEPKGDGKDQEIGEGREEKEGRETSQRRDSQSMQVMPILTRGIIE